jgi:hypothetical protein
VLLVARRRFATIARDKEIGFTAGANCFERACPKKQLAGARPPAKRERRRGMASDENLILSTPSHLRHFSHYLPDGGSGQTTL